MPHAHILLIMEPRYRLKSSGDVDRFVQAEIAHIPSDSEMKCYREKRNQWEQQRWNMIMNSSDEMYCLPKYEEEKCKVQ